MEIVFLGTGTSQGVPMIAHRPKNLDLSNPKNWRTRSSIHVRLGGIHVQIDAGQEFRMQCLREEIDRVDLFILTHGHADHILGMDDLRRYCDILGGQAIPVYGTGEGLERVRAIYPYAVRDNPAVPGYPAFSLREMPAVLEVPGGRIRSTLLPHGSVAVLGLVFEETATGRKAAYYTDCQCVPPEARALADGADAIILDALRPEPHPTHMNIAEAMATARQMRASRVYFTHLTCRVDHDTAQRNLPPGMEFAWDGLRVRLE